MEHYTVHFLLSLVLITVLGIVTGWTDIHSHKIRNKHLHYALLVGVVLHTMFLWGEWVLCGRILVSSLFALAFGVGLWHFRFWTAGDAKLYATMVFLLPPYSPFSFIPVFINLLIIALVLLGAMMLWRLRIAHLKDAILDCLDIRRILSSALGIFSLLWFIPLVFSFVDIQLAPAFQLLVVILLFIVVSRILGEYQIAAFVVLAVGRIFIDPFLFQLDTWVQFLSTFALFFFAKNMIGELGEEVFRRRVPIGELRAGMVPAKVMRLVMPLDDKKKQVIIHPTVQGLSEEEVVLIQKAGHAEKKAEDILVQETVPFAPFIFLGVLATIAMHGGAFLLF
ncbi:MAG: hypothetical protein ACOCWQ_03540 [Nanoarchaeota archaeon]